MLTSHVRRRGFTLVEVLITLAILGLALAAGLPLIATWMQNAQIRTAAESIQNGMHLARTEAIRRNTQVEFKLDNPAATGGTGWTVTVLGEVGNGGNEGVVQIAPGNEGTRNVKLTLTPAAATKLTFSGFGRLPLGASPKNPDNTDVLTQVAIDSASLSAADSRDLRVVITGGSEIRMCDPNVSDLKDPRTCPP